MGTRNPIWTRRGNLRRISRIDSAAALAYFTVMKIFALPLALFCVVLPLSAQAAAPKNLGKFGFWTAYSVTEDKQPLCYMILTAHPPQAKDSGKKKAPKRGDITVMITHRPGESSLDVFSYSAGVKFQPASEAVIGIGKRQFNLFTQDDTAWSRDAATDHALSAALRGAESLTLTGTAAKGTLIADTLQTKGAREAYRAISKACGVAVPDAPKPQKKLQPAKPH